MHKKNAEICHCGWLVKSPPNYRGSIFKARWRRRWFTLKHGELPGQYFLEYFTDSSCRKRKGIIDLDQVEQVDAGLSLDRATIKFQWMFDMKTPNRTYYLAADNEQDMRDWVMVICQVCNLQETEEKNIVNDPSVISAQYHNVNHNNDFEAKEVTQNDLSTNVDRTLLNNTALFQFSTSNDYENDDIAIQSRNNNQDDAVNYSNLSAIESSKQGTSSNSIVKSTGAIKKIPENLKLRLDDKINNNGTDDFNTNRASGPYIPLSDCFSGSPVLIKNESDPKTPLNSLDPKFYDNPRSHITNIGLNLTDDDQPNSPKKTNLQQQNAIIIHKSLKSINSSPTDSDGSTDEEWNEPNKTIDRIARPSDASLENDAIIASAGQCYMKMFANNPIPLPPKRSSVYIDRKIELSDTEENVSPIIGPKDKSSFVDDSCYDFPRSHNIQCFSGSQRDIGKIGSSSTINHGHLMTSTPNLIHSGLSTLERNFYGNAAPSERNVFNFDQESILMPPPEVNRTLKPKKSGQGSNKSLQNAPVIDRKLKPSTSKPQITVGTDSLKRRGPEKISLSEVDDSLLNESMASNHSVGLSPKTPDRLQYLDLDHTCSPQKMLGSIASTSIASNMASLDISFNGSIKDGPGVAYTTVDFLKTDAFNRVREDSEMTRASKSRIKN